MQNLSFSTTNNIYIFCLIAVSYNQPKFCSSASWDPYAITFADNNTIGTFPYGIFVNTNNTVHVAESSNGRVNIWAEENLNLSRTIFDNSSNSFSLFVTTNGDIYIDDGYDGRVAKLSLNATSSVTAIYVNESCYGLFVDINSTIYCSLYNMHQVIKRSLLDNTTMLTVTAGTGCFGFTSNMLYNPCGIFVDINFNLYVADSGNDRVQLFQAGQSNGLTVAGISATVSFTLNCPTGVVLDGDGYLFIVDNGNHRVIRSGPNGFQCVAGCSGTNGSASNQLYYPRTMSFDNYGNMFITDTNNSRVQKFVFATNSCGKCMYICLKREKVG